MTSPQTAGSARRAVIVGANGQDGHYLAEYLAGLGYAVIGVGRDRVVTPSAERPFSILNAGAVYDLLAAEKPDELYYLATHHHSSQESTGGLRALVDTSYDVHCRGLLNTLDAIVEATPRTRLLYAASSLVFGEPAVAPQNEDTPLAPICAYGVAKVTGMGYCRLYRREKGVRCCSGILYNHESPRRAARFVPRKIAQAVRTIKADRGATLTLGDLEARVDWSYAGDVVRAMHAMLQLDAPRDFVVASGTLHSVRDFVERAFRAAGLDYRDHVVQAAGILQRSTRNIPLQGDTSQLRAATGWSAQVSFEQLVDMMVQAELAAGPET